MRLSRELSLLTTRNSISPFRSSISAGCGRVSLLNQTRLGQLTFSGNGITFGALGTLFVSGSSLLELLILLLSEGVFGSSVAFRFVPAVQISPMRSRRPYHIAIPFSLMVPILVDTLFEADALSNSGCDSLP